MTTGTNSIIIRFCIRNITFLYIRLLSLLPVFKFYNEILILLIKNIAAKDNFKTKSQHAHFFMFILTFTDRGQIS